ncbi:MAG TPA: hypothetical protein VGE00_05115 [Gammaproteobacteria bacterium]
MPIALFVFSFLSFLGVASGAVLLLSDVGVIEIARPLMLWLMFVGFSLLGPSGIMMTAQRPGRPLGVLGMAFTALGVIAITAVFAASLGVIAVRMPMLELLVLAPLTLTGGIFLIAAARIPAAPGEVN